MKKVLLTLVALMMAMALEAGYNYSVTKIDAASVPSSVKNAFHQDFPGVRVKRWEHHTSKGKKHAFGKYVCIFDAKNNVRSRARYKENGMGISATKYYWMRAVKKLPQTIKNYCAKHYAAYKITAGEKEISLSKNKSAYRIKMRRGGTKITVWLDEAGNEINKNNLVDDWKVSEKE